MADSRMLYPHMDWATKQLATVVGSFEMDDPVANVLGDGFAITRVGAGEYTITMSREYPAMVCALGTILDGSGADSNLDLVVTFEPYTGVSTHQILLRVARADGTPALEETADTSRVSFMLVFKKYSVL